MKHKILAFLAVFCLCFSMIGTASAADVVYDYGNSSVDTFLSAHSSDFSDYRYLVITSTKGATQTGYVYSWNVYASNSVFNYSHENQFDRYIYIGSGDFVRYSYSVNNSSNPVVTSYASGKTIEFSNSPSSLNQSYYANFELSSPVKYTYIDFVPSPSECDGSTCPATDLNADGICDDCGKTLSLRLVTYPTLPDVSGSNKHSVVLDRDDGYFYMVLTSDTSYSISGTVGDTYLITVANEQEVDYVTYKCTDGKNWVHNNSGKAYSLSVGSSSSATLLASTFDWSKDGDHFFPVPPTLAEVTEEALGEMVENLGQTVWILVLCGVGCLALLIALLLLPKVLRRFLG